MPAVPESLVEGLTIRSITPVTGGDIARAYRLETDDGPRFCKIKADATPDLFEREAAGLELLRRHAPASIGVPEVLRVDPTGLILEWIEVGSRRGRSEVELGHGLAELHRTANPTFGAIDSALAGYLGSAEVDLTPTTSWPEFFIERRMRPLTQRAVSLGRIDSRAESYVDRLARRAADLCGPPEPPALVHGDLWGGNRLVDRTGRNWLIDPACHWGHREGDIAMMHLFGGFGGESFAAYDETFPLAEGWRDRVEWYQLPPLLVHAILFGGSYGDSAQRVMERYL